MSSLSGPGARPDPFARVPDAAQGETPAPSPAPAAAPAPPAAPGESRMDRLGRLLGVPAKSPPVVASPQDRAQDVVCPVIGAMIKEGKIKLDANGNMDLGDFKDMLAKDMHFSRPLAAMTAGAGYVGNRPQDVLGNLFGSRMNPLALRGGMVKHPGDSMILENGKFDEAKFQAVVRHATDAKVVDGKVVSGRLTVNDMAEVVAANVARDAARFGRKEGQALAVAEFGAIVTMFGERDPKTGERSISVEALRALYEKKVLPKPSGTAADPTTVRDYMGVMAEVTWKLPGASPTGVAKDGARVAAGMAASTITPAMLGAAKGVCPHMQAQATGSPPVNAREIGAIGAARNAVSKLFG